MTIDEILKRLDLKLGMKIIDMKPSDIVRTKNNIYTLTARHHDILVFENSDDFFFQVVYVLIQLDKRFKVIENE